MSWDDFSAALVARVEAVTGTGKVHPYWPLNSDAPTHPKFKELFVEDGVFNAWLFRVESFGGTLSVDDDRTESVLHQVTLTAMKALTEDAEVSLNSALWAVREDFRTGDRTLGNRVNTISIIDWDDIGEAMFGRSVAVLRAEGRFLVEELLR